MPETNVPASIRGMAELYREYKRRVYTLLRQRQAQHERLYELTEELLLPKEEFTVPIMPPEARQMVLRPVNHIAMDSLNVKRDPKRSRGKGVETKEAQENADRVERWCIGLLDYIKGQMPFFLRSLVFNQVYRGEGYLKYVWTDEYREHYQGDRNSTFQGIPWDVSVPNAGTIYASLDMKQSRPMELFEETVITVRSLRQVAQSLSPGRRRKVMASSPETAFVRLVEWWTGTERGYFAADNTMSVVEVVPLDGDAAGKNEYGYVPYCRTFSGWGDWPADGDPRHIAVGILTGWEKRLIGQARLMTVVDSIAAKVPFAPFSVSAPPGVDIPESVKVKLDPGAVNTFPLGMKGEFIQPPQIPPAVAAELAQIRQELEGFQPSITAGAGSGSEAAISKTMRIGQASLQWEPVYIHAKQAISNMLSQMLYCVDKVMGHQVEIDGLSIGPRHINGYYKTQVEIKPGNPQTVQFDRLQGKDLIGILPREIILRDFMHYDDVTDIERKLLVEEARQAPALRAWLIQKAMRDMEMDIEAEQTAAGAPVGGPPGPSLGRPNRLPGVGGSATRGVTPLPQQEQMQQMAGQVGGMGAGG